MATNPKQQFYNNLGQVLDICMFSDEKLTDGQILIIANKTKDNFEYAKKLAEENQQLKNQMNRLSLLTNELSRNSYYKRNKPTRQRKILTLEEKTRSNEYINCPFCDNIIKESYANKHYTNQICASNQHKKEVMRTNKHIHIKHNKASQLMNMYIRLCLYDTSSKNKKTNGFYWKYIDLMNIYKSMSIKPKTHESATLCF